MTSGNNNQREGFSSNSSVGACFENNAFEYFKNKEGIILEKNYEVTLGVEWKKKHRFDFGSNTDRILVECKSHTWTKGANVPSAKISVWNEAMFYFNLSPKEYKKILFVLMDFSQEQHKTLVQFYIANYYHFIPKDVIFYEYFPNDGHCEKYDYKTIENVIRRAK
jgi:hypothetical protein